MNLGDLDRLFEAHVSFPNRKTSGHHAQSGGVLETTAACGTLHRRDGRNTIAAVGWLASFALISAMIVEAFR